MSRTVFISHSSDDKAIGAEVCRFLEKNGILCWIAPRDVTPGKNYGAAILDAIDECRVFILILSSHSNKSGQVVREVERAASTNSIIIPLRVENVSPSRDLEFYVSSAHWLDASTRPLEKHLRELLKAIKDWQASDGTLHDRRTSAPSPAPVAAPVAPIAAASPRSRSFIIAGAAIAGLILLAIAIYQLGRHKASRPSTVEAVATPSVAGTPALEPSTGAPSQLREIVATSQHDNHAANFAFDGDPTTSWVADTDGVGQSITANFKSPTTITSVSILNGNAKDLEHYQGNNRVSTLRIKWSDGFTQVISLQDEMKMQHFALQHRAATDWIKFEILSIYPGERNNWAAISEIAFNRDTSDAIAEPSDNQKSQPRR